jgi:tRNA modification GTPase
MGATTTTICAVASPPGGGRRAVLRLSGPDAASIVKACCSGVDGPLALAERGLWPARFDDGTGEQPALLYWMPGPRSYTREDVAEVHIVGSPPLVSAALEHLLGLGAAAAQPGEFTRRAFTNGRLDLTRAEGVLELVCARNDEQRRAATALLVGGLDGRVAALRARTDDLRALIEASLDFDETDTGHIPPGELAQAVHSLLAELEAALGWERRRVPASGLPRVVLAGAPNAGKSSLFNRLTGGGGLAPALVSAHPGTTRDSKHAEWSVRGQRVLLIDTAGEDERAAGAADQAAQSTRQRERDAADLSLVVVDSSAPHGSEFAVGEARVVAWNQVDRADARPAPQGAIPVSALTGAGLEELAVAVAAALAGAGSGLGRELSARHLRALEEAGRRVREALAGLEAGQPLDLFAEGLRGATEALDSITGRTTPEDVLDRIFARFCLGK